MPGFGGHFVGSYHGRSQDCCWIQGRRVELVPRIGFEDRIAATILRMLFEEAPRTDPGSALFIERALDLLCVQLVRAHSSAKV